MSTGISSLDGLSPDLNLSGNSNSVHFAQDCIMVFNFLKDARPIRMRRDRLGSLGLIAMLGG